MKHSAKPNDIGFTIVETLFVLAIAGLIMLIVFEAIPNLQRTSRNNQRKQDVNTVLETVSHYELSNSGAIPDGPTLRTALQNSTHKLTIYDPANVDVTFTDVGQAGSNQNNNSTIDEVKIYNHAKCDPSANGDATGLGAGYNDVVALFAVESSNSITPQCQQL